MEYIPTAQFQDSKVDQNNISRNLINQNSRSNRTSGKKMLHLPMHNDESGQKFEQYREYSNRTSPKIPLIKSGQSMTEYNKMIHKQI